jgi:hypothetical protein
VATMMGQSNDWFYAPAESGIALFKDGKPISGEISSQIILWDAGTEVDQEPGIGSDQGPRQTETALCATRRMSNTAAHIPRCLA